MSLAKLGLTPKTLVTCLLLSALAVAALLAAAPAPAQAATGKCGSEIHYYSDSTFTHQVGLRGWLPFNCGCQAYSSGTISSFSRVLSSVC